MRWSGRSRQRTLACRNRPTSAWITARTPVASGLKPAPRSRKNGGARRAPSTGWTRNPLTQSRCSDEWWTLWKRHRTAPRGSSGGPSRWPGRRGRSRHEPGPARQGRHERAEDQAGEPGEAERSRRRSPPRRRSAARTGGPPRGRGRCRGPAAGSAGRGGGTASRTARRARTRTTTAITLSLNAEHHAGDQQQASTSAADDPRRGHGRRYERAERTSAARPTSASPDRRRARVRRSVPDESRTCRVGLTSAHRATSPVRSADVVIGRPPGRSPRLGARCATSHPGRTVGAWMPPAVDGPRRPGRRPGPVGGRHARRHACRRPTRSASSATSSRPPPCHGGRRRRRRRPRVQPDPALQAAHHRAGGVRAPPRRHRADEGPSGDPTAAAPRRPRRRARRAPRAHRATPARRPSRSPSASSCAAPTATRRPPSTWLEALDPDARAAIDERLTEKRDRLLGGWPAFDRRVVAPHPGAGGRRPSPTARSCSTAGPTSSSAGRRRRGRRS